MSAEVYDDTYSVTIQISSVGGAMPEPKADIIKVEAPKTANVGDKITVKVTVKNVGGDGIVFCRLFDGQGNVIGPKLEESLRSGESVVFQWDNIEVPDVDTFKIVAKAGHYIPGYRPPDYLL